MSSVHDETSIRTSRPGLTQANGSRSLERLLFLDGSACIALYRTVHPIGLAIPEIVNAGVEHSLYSLQ